MHNKRRLRHRTFCSTLYLQGVHIQIRFSQELARSRSIKWRDGSASAVSSRPHAPSTCERRRSAFKQIHPCPCIDCDANCLDRAFDVLLANQDGPMDVDFDVDDHECDEDDDLELIYQIELLFACAQIFASIAGFLANSLQFAQFSAVRIHRWIISLGM